MSFIIMAQSCQGDSLPNFNSPETTKTFHAYDTARFHLRRPILRDIYSTFKSLNKDTMMKMNQRYYLHSAMNDNC